MENKLSKYNWILFIPIAITACIISFLIWDYVFDILVFAIWQSIGSHDMHYHEFTLSNIYILILTYSRTAISILLFFLGGQYLFNTEEKTKALTILLITFIFVYSIFTISFILFFSSNFSFSKPFVLVNFSVNIGFAIMIYSYLKKKAIPRTSN